MDYWLHMLQLNLFFPTNISLFVEQNNKQRAKSLNSEHIGLAEAVQDKG